MAEKMSKPEKEEELFVMYRKSDGKRVVGSMEALADDICKSLNLPHDSIELTKTNDPSKLGSDGLILGAIGVVKKSCGGCSSTNAKKRCAQCQTQFYCSVDCQRLHWKVHKKICQKHF
jgi:hypothetical protein